MKHIRFNLFKRAHKGLRALLADTVLMLQKTDFLIPGEAAAALKRIRLVLEFMHGHARLEDKFIFPVLGDEASSVIDYFNSQHYQDEALTLGLEVVLTNFEEAQEETQKSILGENILSDFIDFAAFNFTHMNMEEQLINPLLWLKFSDEELQNLVTQAVKSSIIKNDHLFMQWMFNNNTNAEVGAWLHSIREQAAVPQYDLIYQLAKEALDSARMEVINQHLNRSSPFS